ncbi:MULTISPECIES: hypothetical protein [Aphanizomenonaceae]|jgi:hypothetical protein|uniref:Uncharacterized protein n=1 Tax=Dolichospermum heterosporum TAC447 TaxID=747523 RepID=A0ABY5LZE2_9CYAN|nr:MULTISPECIES: hypothetical protein [Aphanizomenonaceae]MBE9259981.1 hypothetical protein [Dolichospermum sp. LEGE 00246]MDK2412705.1 hypothetical protein [Aphanizomenon sp. 202]MDK2459787.1 hypothetical protein [Aphanizomenon sp. PH219]UUO17403.1 hypothetical protein NG743_10685 [Dolichospermum heterosporum TAC447]
MNKDRIELAKETLTTHKENMRKTLERRLQLAKAQNDENLSRQLEGEMREYSENPEPSGIKIDSLGFLRIFKTILAPKRGK